MNAIKCSRRALTLLLCLILSGPNAGLAEPGPAPLRILLTNDDGIEAPGIGIMRDTLVAAGHEVTVVAPLQDQSGSSIRVTISGTMQTRKHANGMWSVDGYPADAVLVGLQQLFSERAPDLIVSGPNFGPNLGFALSSGTVGAATMAMFAGVPAMAVSVGVNPAEYGAQPIAFPSTFKALGGAAELTAELIGDLQASRSVSAALLPSKTILNLNYPPVNANQFQGVRVLPATPDVGARLSYEETAEAGKLKVVLKMLNPDGGDDQDADWRWFARGYATISVLDGNTDAGDSLRGAIAQRLSKHTSGH
jgi:5'/3'-nucleotidase SurE